MKFVIFDTFVEPFNNSQTGQRRLSKLLFYGVAFQQKLIQDSYQVL